MCAVAEEVVGYVFFCCPEDFQTTGILRIGQWQVSLLKRCIAFFLVLPRYLRDLYPRIFKLTNFIRCGRSAINANKVRTMVDTDCRLSLLTNSKPRFQDLKNLPALQYIHTMHILEEPHLQPVHFAPSLSSLPHFLHDSPRTNFKLNHRRRPPPTDSKNTPAMMRIHPQLMHSHRLQILQENSARRVRSTDGVSNNRACSTILCFRARLHVGHQIRVYYLTSKRLWI